MPVNVTYGLDTTGIAVSNFISNENHSVSEINDLTYNLIIPVYAPFYLDKFKIVHVNLNGTESVLDEGLDYSFTLPFLGASRSIGKMLYGGISIMSIPLKGWFKVSYQTLGGNWVANAGFVLVALANSNYNPRTTSWDTVTNVQQTFPPTNHEVNIDQLKGHEDLIAAVNNISSQILVGQTESNRLLLHKLDVSNPHLVNKSQIGLGNVENLSVVTEAEIDGKINVRKYLTFDMFLRYVAKHGLGGEIIVPTKPTLELRSSKDVLIGYIYSISDKTEPKATIPISYEDGVVIGYVLTEATAFCPDTLQDAEGVFIGYFKSS